MGARKLEYLPYYTYSDYKEWEGDWELIDGVPYAMAPSPMRKYQSLAYEVAFNLRSEIEECHYCEVLGEIDYKIDEDTVVRPDVVLTCGEVSKKYLLKAPEIVVEVVSKSSAKLDEGYKRILYASQKVTYYILVYPDDLCAKVFILKDGVFDLEGTFSTDTYQFDKTSCRITLDFGKIFDRFRE